MVTRLVKISAAAYTQHILPSPIFQRGIEALKTPLEVFSGKVFEGCSIASLSIFKVPDLFCVHAAIPRPPPHDGGADRCGLRCGLRRHT